MTNITLTIEAQGRTQRMSQTGVAMLLGLQPEFVQEKISWYLTLGSHHEESDPPEQPIHTDKIPGEGGKGGKGHVNGNEDVNGTYVGDVSSVGNDTNVGDVQENIYLPNVGNVSDETSGEGRGLGKETPKEPTPLAEHLAEQLGDRVSLGCYRHLVEHHPRARLERALQLTLNVSVEHLLKSRAAYFMGIVRTLAKQEANSST